MALTCSSARSRSVISFSSVAEARPWSGKNPRNGLWGNRIVPPWSRPEDDRQASLASGVIGSYHLPRHSLASWHVSLDRGSLRYLDHPEVPVLSAPEVSRTPDLQFRSSPTAPAD